MDISDILRLIILIILIGLSAFFSSAETALTTVNKLKMRSLFEAGNKRAGIVLKITDNPSKMLSAVLIGNNIINLSASALATSFTIKLFGNRAVGFATGILTFLILILGEVTPKTIAAVKAERISLAYVVIIKDLMWVMTPLIVIVNTCAKFILKLFRIDPQKRSDTITEDELLTAVDVSREEGVIEDDEHEIFHNVIQFGDTIARDVMVPRIHMVTVDINSNYEEVMEIYSDCLFTRIPVFEDNLDHIVGIINMKDLLLVKDRETFKVNDVLRDVLFTYETKDTSELLLDMRKGSYNLAIVLDEYGQVSGLITLEDLLEEIVGEIKDEFDSEEVAPVIKISDNKYLA